MADLTVGQTAAEDFYLSGTAVIAGSVAITSSAALTQTGSVAITSSTALTQTGSVAVTSSVHDVIFEQPRRAPNFDFSGAIFTTSGLTANMLVPPAGSKVLLKWVSINSDVASFVAVKFSGLTNAFVQNYWLPASGTVIQNFIGGEPSGGADMPLGIGVGTAGNVNVSAGVRYVP